MLSPENAHQHARELFRDERYGESVQALGDWLRNNPQDAVAHHDLAAPLFALGELAQAEESAQRAVQLSPSFAQAWCTLATIQSQRGQAGTPLRAMLQATRLEPENLHYQQRLATLLVDQGHLDTAVAMFKTINKAHPEDLDTSAGLATALERAGDLDVSFDMMLPLIGTGVVHARLGTTWAAVCRRRGEPERGISTLTMMLEKPLNRLARIMLLGELGTCHDHLGNHDAAFSAYTRANQIRRGQFKPQELIEQTDAIIETFSAEALSRLPRNPDQDERPIFIVGVPRSGTSLVEQILASHPDVHGCGELEDLRASTLLLSPGTTEHYTSHVHQLTPQMVSRLGRWYLDRRQQDSGNTRRFTDKLPQNFQHLGWASLILPGARIIHCQRNPLDTALSCYFQGFRDALAWSNRLDWLGCYIQQYRRLMDHWNTVCPLPIHGVDYQALVADPEPQIRKLVSFCGLDWDEAVMAHHTSARTVDTASYAQATQPIYKSSVGRAQRYARHLEPLKRLLGDE